MQAYRFEDRCWTRSCPAHVRLSEPDWLQARQVTLYENGVKANTVFRDRSVVNGPVDDTVFSPPAR